MRAKMLVVELNRENIEYDVHSLVKAFFPEEQVAVLIPESSEKKREELGDKVSLEELSAFTDMPVEEIEELLKLAGEKIEDEEEPKEEEKKER